MKYSGMARSGRRPFAVVERKKQLPILFLVALLVFFFSPCSYAKERNDDSSFGAVIGYGASHPGWGATTEKIETIDIAFRYESSAERPRGLHWYKSRRSFVIEIPLHIVGSSYSSFMLGASFLSRWTFEGKIIKPYLLAGGGPVYSFANIRGMSSKINGSYQVGAGLEFIINSRRYFADIRYHHISNGSIREPNIPLNSSKILFGMDF